MGTVQGRVVVRGGAVPPRQEAAPSDEYAAHVRRSTSLREDDCPTRQDGCSRAVPASPASGRYSVGGTFTKSEPLAQAAKKVILVRPVGAAHVQLTEGVVSRPGSTLRSAPTAR